MDTSHASVGARERTQATSPLQQQLAASASQDSNSNQNEPQVAAVLNFEKDRHDDYTQQKRISGQQAQDQMAMSFQNTRLSGTAAATTSTTTTSNNYDDKPPPSPGGGSEPTLLAGTHPRRVSDSPHDNTAPASPSQRSSSSIHSTSMEPTVFAAKRSSNLSAISIPEDYNDEEEEKLPEDYDLERTSLKNNRSTSQVEQDALLKAGLRRTAPATSAMVGATFIPAAVSADSMDSTSSSRNNMDYSNKSQRDQDARLKAGLRRTSGASQVGAVTVPRIDSMDDASSMDGSSMSQIERDRRYKAGLRNYNNNSNNNNNYSTTARASPVPPSSSYNNNATPPFSSNQLHADARLKAGLRNNTTRTSAQVGATHVPASPSAVPRSTTTTTTTTRSSISSQVERDAKLKAGLRNNSHVMTGTASANINTTSSSTQQFDADAWLKAGLRSNNNNNKRGSAAMVGAVSVAAAAPSINDTIDSSVATQEARDSQVKAGLRKTKMVIGNTNLAASTAVVATEPMMDGSIGSQGSGSRRRGTHRRSSSDDADNSIRMKHGLRNSGVATAVPRSSVASSANNDDVARQKRGLRSGSAAAQPGAMSVATVAAAPMAPESPSSRLHRTRQEIENFSEVLGGASSAIPSDKSDHPLFRNQTVNDKHLAEGDHEKNPGIRSNDNVQPAALVANATTVRVPPVASTATTPPGAYRGLHQGQLFQQAQALEKGTSVKSLSSSNQGPAVVKASPSHADHSEKGTDKGELKTPVYGSAEVHVTPPEQRLRKSMIASKKRKKALCILLIAFVVIIGIVLGVVLGTASSGSGGNNTKQAATAAPAPQPTQPPAPPVYDVFPNTPLPEDTIAAIESQKNTVPQYNAFLWLAQDPNLIQYSEAQLLQRFVLATFYYSTNGDEWLVNSDLFSTPDIIPWLDYDSHECEWLSLASIQGHTPCSSYNYNDSESIRFDHHDFTSLVLTGDPTWAPESLRLYKQIRGYLVPELALLPSLRRLDIGLQSLKGSIPSEIERMSSTLQHVVLYDNALTGTIPEALFEFTEQLWLSHNSFDRAPIPSVVGANPTLRSLFLINCDLTGSIPEELFQLSNLQELYLAQNQLEGSISTDFGRMSSLVSLTLSENRFTSAIPTELGGLTNLGRLEAEANKLNGIIPSELGELTELTVLSLQGNRLQGTLPTELAQLSQLLQLKLSSRERGNRDLTGTLPLEYLVRDEPVLNEDFVGTAVAFSGSDGTRWLRSLQNGENGTSGTEIDIEDGADLDSSNRRSSTIAFPHLIDLWIADARLSGEIPSTIGLLTTLKTVRLGWNRGMVGTIPTEFGLLASSLTELSLGDNGLTSTIPSELGLLTFLQELRLQDNDLVGTIPSELGELAATIKWLRFDGNNNLEGPVPESFCAVESFAMGCENDQLFGDTGKTNLCGCHCPCDDA